MIPEIYTILIDGSQPYGNTGYINQYTNHSTADTAQNHNTPTYSHTNTVIRNTPKNHRHKNPNTRHMRHRDLSF